LLAIRNGRDHNPITYLYLIDGLKFMTATIRLLLLAAAYSNAVSLAHGEDKNPAKPAENSSQRFALLVGVTKYSQLGDRFELEGPGNDVVLFRRVLLERFRFQEDQIVTLAEAIGRPERRPTFANIKQQIYAITAKAKAGDQVVILLAGHGTQVPDQDPPQPDDPEPDGLDEAFLPADAAHWEAGVKDIPNAIRDDDLRKWMKDLTATGAYVWVVADCCHSGTILRSADQEKPRRLKPDDLGIPQKEIDAARARAAKMFGATRGGEARDTSPFIKAEDKSDRLVGVYACLSNEETVERVLPQGSRDAQPHGLLTYTICQILEGGGNRPPTYRELVTRVDDQYKRWGRTFPTPLVEGKGQNREVLGVDQWPSPPFRLQTNMGQWKVDGGRLHGLTERSILAVYAPLTDAKAPVGHVRVVRARTQDADVEPCEFGKQPAPKDLVTGSRCDPVFVDYGDLRLTVAAAALTTTGKTLADAERQRLQQNLRQLADAKGSILELVDNPADARCKWLLTAEGNQNFLMPAQGAVRGSDGTLRPQLGPFGLDDKGAVEMKEALGRLARAENLLKLVGGQETSRGRTPSRMKVNVELVKFRDQSDRQGEVVGRNDPLHPGDLIAFRVRNRSEGFAVYPTLLFVDASYGIKCLYPDEGEIVERLPPGESFTTDVLRVRTGTLGLEHVVVLAVKAAGPPVDFSRLEQPTIEKARGTKLRGGRDGLGSPLGQLLQQAFFAEGGTRGLEKVAIDEYAADRFSWNTVPAERSSDGK
jgi:hypothetical protein